MKRCILSFLVIVSFLIVVPPTQAEQLPVSSWLGLPAIKWPIISPDGKHIAALLLDKKSGTYKVGVTTFGGTQFDIVAKLQRDIDHISNLSWANNERLLIASSYPRYVGGSNYRVPRLYAVNIDGSDSKELFHYAFRDSNDSYLPEADVVSMLRNDPKHILVQWIDDRDRAPAVYKLNVYDSSFEKQFTNDHHISAWYSNDAGEVILGVQQHVTPWKHDKGNDEKYTFWYRTSSDQPWKPIKTVDFSKNQASFDVITPATQDGKSLYVFSNRDRGYTTLYKYDIETGKYSEPIFKVAGHDLDNALVRHDKLIGVSWTENYTHVHYLDADNAAIRKLVQQTFKGAQIYIVDRDDANKRFIIQAERDNLAPRFFLLDLAKKNAMPWFSMYPQVKGANLATKRPFQYKARDGMQLNGYLTLPADTNAKKKPPVIVLPHGGPWGRDTQDYDNLVQWMANRGYAVLQMNFRGSTGFGSAYEHAGFRQFGKKMQTDIMDAVDWLKKQDVADTGNMCMLGWSYGGYASLTASFEMQDSFKCFVSIAGISDLVALSSREAHASLAMEQMRRRMGDVESDADKKDLMLHSAYYHVREIKRPVLVVYGTDDTIVAYEQSAKFVNKAHILKHDNIKGVEIEHGSHSLTRRTSRLKAFSAIDEFLAKNLN